MEYTCCTFSFNPKSEIYCDVLASLLGDIGFESFEVIDGELQSYIPSTLYNKDNIDGLISDFPILDIEITYKTCKIPSKNWNQQWESTFTPILIDKLVCIHSSDYPRSQDVQYDIIINPCMAFGSGNHSTTRMVLRMLLKSELHGKKVLDVGCGTGVLGIGAKLGGCDSITSLDIDIQSVENTRYNFSLNGVTAEIIAEGSIDILKSDQCFDIILANIHLNVHLILLEQYVSHLLPGGSLILSGFYSSDSPQIKQSCEKYGLRMSECNEENNWSALKFEKPIIDQ